MFFFPGLEKPAIVTKMNMTLSADRRVFDSEIGGKPSIFDYNIERKTHN